MGTFSGATPARRRAARVLRGWISGVVCVAGIDRARKVGFPLALSLLPPAVEGFVALEGAYPSSEVVLRNAERIEDDIDRIDP